MQENGRQWLGSSSNESFDFWLKAEKKTLQRLGVSEQIASICDISASQQFDDSFHRLRVIVENITHFPLFGRSTKQKKKRNKNENERKTVTQYA